MLPRVKEEGVVDKEETGEAVVMEVEMAEAVEEDKGTRMGKEMVEGEDKDMEEGEDKETGGGIRDVEETLMHLTWPSVEAVISAKSQGTLGRNVGKGKRRILIGFQSLSGMEVERPTMHKMMEGEMMEEMMTGAHWLWRVVSPHSQGIR
jgi:hypothetical protein